MNEDHGTDLETIQLLEHAQGELDRGGMPKREVVFRILACTRRLLTDLFRARIERDQARGDLHLLEQGQRLLLPLPLTDKP